MERNSKARSKMMTLFAALTIIFLVVTIYISMAFANFCRRKFGWDEAGIALLMLGFLWIFPFTVAYDMGWLQ
jgi:high-affinity K+ transport system ATPase subunit B